MMNDPDQELQDEMRRHHTVEEAVRKADAVILEQRVSDDEMFEVTYLVGMKMLEKVGFQLNVRRMKRQIESNIKG